MSYAATVIVPAAVPIASAEVIVALVVPSAVSLIVPEFNASGFAPITRTSSAFVAALAAAIVHLNISSFVVDPDR